MEFGSVHGVEENLPRLVHLLEMVILGKVGICGAGFLDSLEAISDRSKGQGPIGVESKLSMGPVKDNGDTFRARTCGREGERSVAEDKCQGSELRSAHHCPASGIAKLHTTSCFHHYKNRADLQHLEQFKKTRGHAQCKGDTGILREIEGFGVWLCIRLFGDER